ncbi:predicted protein [Nematostella vectensis]|uniref:NEDD8 ultimate buster 1 n=1 Tax=Nematostella vectensis TaxID=45351 RepID=A7RI15_NEMVE|nr:predicted protein [Nematostella vectensis]|eukprot:XP_001641133.1 predicted protein [Nematostella vectensis]
MEESSGINEGVLFRLREVLNRDKVRLWLPPYSSEDGHAGIYPEELISQYTRELGFSKPTIAEALEHLRTHALEKLSAKKRFQASGLASIRVHLAGQHSRKMNMEISLKLTGAELRKRLGDEFTMDPVRLKLICNGQVLKEDSPLDSQTVTNNSQILAIALSETEVEARKKLLKDEHAASSLDWTRKAAEALSSRTEDTSNLDYFLEIRDQEGRPLQLPDAERKALALAMTLHEKGKSMLKQKNYSEALVVLLEADKEFSQCRAQILEAVDNYAILCLDVVWCYFGIRSIRDLPDAEARLQKCEECFEKSYGMNMERLTSVRGGSGQELALFVRLYVLQAVCAYHRGRRDHALILLNKAEEWTRKLSVDDDKLSQMVAMGFSVREARLGLRCCHGDVTSAVDHITSKRQEKKERTLREKEEQKKKRAQRKLGKTANGEWVNVSSLESLVDMGFPRQSAAEALRQTNNSMDGALQVRVPEITQDVAS